MANDDTPQPPALITIRIPTDEEYERATGEFAAIRAVENTPEYHAWVQHFNTCAECQHWSVCEIGSGMLAKVTGQGGDGK